MAAWIRNKSVARNTSKIFVISFREDYQEFVCLQIDKNAMKFQFAD